MSDDRDPPNLDMLIKLMKMTTSANDSEALVAMRMANAALTKFGNDWEALLRGKVKITVVADPFASTGPAPIGDFASRRDTNGGYRKPTAPAAPLRPTPPTPKPAPQPAAAAQSAQKQRQAARPAPHSNPISFRKNSNGYWNVKSPLPLTLGAEIDVIQKSGALKRVKIMAHTEVNKFGEHLYQFVDVTITSKLGDLL